MPHDEASVEPPGTARILDTLAALAEPVLAIDNQHRVFYANPAAIETLALDAGALPQPLHAVVADDTLLHRLQQTLAPNRTTPTVAGEFLWRHTRQTFVVRVQPAGDDHLILFAGISRRASLQSRLDAAHMRRYWAAALAGMGSWTWDLDANRLRSDTILANLIGLDDEHAISAEDMLEQIVPEDRPRLEAALQRAIDSDCEADVDIDVEFRVRVPNGTEMWLAMRGGVIHDNQGRPLALSGVHFDVTDRKRAERSLVQAKEALEEASRAKDHFLARVSHEIRTPLTTILGYAELIAQRTVRPQDRKDLEEILDSCRYLQSLVDDLLDLSRVIAGKVAIKPQVVDLRHLGHELLSTVNMRAAEKDLGFALNISPGIPSQTWTDPVRLRQVLMNLIGNAVKFTEQGEVSVRMAPRELDDQRFVAFEIHDTGPGIDPNRLTQLFEPFAQADGAAGGRHAGLGLGLAISQRLAELLGGRIEVDSHPGAGSTFTFLLPVADVDTAQLEADSALTDDTKVTSLPQDALQARVLVVDDVPAILALLEQHLAQAGADVVTASNGIEALDRIEAAASGGQPFDAVLMDLHMPYLDGAAALRRLRDAGHKVAVIALTASAMKGERERCLQLGFADFIAKPFKAAELVGSVARVLAGADAGATPASANPAAGRTLILVEDHEALAELTARQLEGLGFVVETAHTAAAAIDRAQAIKPDAMVVDLSLPDMDGIELCHTLRQDTALAHCRIVAYTGETEPERHAQALEAGYAAVLVKPADATQFGTALAVDATNG